MPAAASTTPSTFEQALSRLETIVQDLETDSVDLETALARYEEGVQLAQLCMERLRKAELRIQSLALEE